MYIDKISLSNVRGFEELEFSLVRPDGSYAGWTVFTGDNGSGKSTLLKAIAVALTGKDTARALQPSFHRWIREGRHEASIELGIARMERDDFLTEGGRLPEKVFRARPRSEEWPEGAIGRRGLARRRDAKELLDAATDDLVPGCARMVLLWLWTVSARVRCVS